MPGKLKAQIEKTVLETVMLFAILLFLLPVWMVLINSVKSTAEANRLAVTLPSVFRFDNYVTVFRESNLLQGFFNGLFIATAVGIVAVLASSMASFFIARSATRFSKFSYGYFIVGLIVPVAVIPTYFALLTMNLNNTYTGLILIFAAYAMPLSIFLYTGFIRTVPKEIDEAAIVDGCGGLSLFYKVVFPLLSPVTATIVVFNFVGVWNDVTTFLYFAGGDKWSLPMTVYLFFGKYSQQWNLVFADIVFTIAPCLLLYLLGQKYVVSGMTAGAVKG